jgi:hypothetical protein
MSRIALYISHFVNGWVIYHEPGRGWLMGFKKIVMVLLLLFDVSLLEKRVAKKFAFSLSLS